MTNYEWLVKQGKLESFIFDIRVESCDFLKAKYGIIIEWGDNISEKIAEWLQAERPIKEYVALDEVLDIIKETITKAEAKDVIQKLPRKEIDE